MTGRNFGGELGHFHADKSQIYSSISMSSGRHDWSITANCHSSDVIGSQKNSSTFYDVRTTAPYSRSTSILSGTDEFVCLVKFVGNNLLAFQFLYYFTPLICRY